MSADRAAGSSVLNRWRSSSCFKAFILGVYASSLLLFYTSPIMSFLKKLTTDRIKSSHFSRSNAESSDVDSPTAGSISSFSSPTTGSFPVVSDPTPPRPTPSPITRNPAIKLDGSQPMKRDGSQKHLGAAFVQSTPVAGGGGLEFTPYQGFTYGRAPQYSESQQPYPGIRQPRYSTSS